MPPQQTVLPVAVWMAQVWSLPAETELAAPSVAGTVAWPETLEPQQTTLSLAVRIAHPWFAPSVRLRSLLLVVPVDTTPVVLLTVSTEAGSVKAAPQQASEPALVTPPVESRAQLAFAPAAASIAS